MLQVSLRHPNGFSRIYYKDVMVNANELRGAAETDYLRHVLPPETSLQLAFSGEKVAAYVHGKADVSIDDQKSASETFNQGSFHIIRFGDKLSLLLEVRDVQGYGIQGEDDR